MNINLCRLARHVNSNPTIYVGHPMSIRMVSFRVRGKVAEVLNGVHEPLCTFGAEVLAYYRTPKRARCVMRIVSSDRLIQRIDEASARFESLECHLRNDPRYLWTQLNDHTDARLWAPDNHQMTRRLSTLDMPGSRVVMKSMLMAANVSSKKLAELMAFDNCYISFRNSLRAQNVFEWVWPALEDIGVDLDGFFDDMNELMSERQFRVPQFSPSVVSAYTR